MARPHLPEICDVWPHKHERGRIHYAITDHTGYRVRLYEDKGSPLYDILYDYWVAKTGGRRGPKKLPQHIK